MATVYVGSARSDENGRAYGGKAGDQKSGREVSTQAYYVHDYGWRVFRPIDEEKAQKMAEAMRVICDDNDVGYDQHQRTSLYNLLKQNGFDIYTINKKTETDCSALVRVCAKYAGIDLPDFNTSSEPKALLESGQFKELTGSKYTSQSAYLGAGDVLCTSKKGHTVIVLNNGSKYEGSTLQPMDEYALFKRELSKNDKGDDVAELQRILIGFGYDLGTYGQNKDGVDGEYGTLTVKAVRNFQSKYGLEADGICGRLTQKKIAELQTPESVFKIRVTGNLVNVRNAPNTSTGVPLRTVKKGVILNAVGVDTATGWFKLDDGNYISNRYSEKV